MSDEQLQSLSRMVEKLADRVMDLTIEVAEVKTELKSRPDFQQRIDNLEQFVDQIKGAKLALAVLLTTAGALGGLVGWVMQHLPAKTP